MTAADPSARQSELIERVCEPCRGGDHVFHVPGRGCTLAQCSCVNAGEPPRSGFWDRLGVDDGGMPTHLPMGVNADGEGPENDSDAHHFVCWCGDKNCPLTNALALAAQPAAEATDRDECGMALSDGSTCARPAGHSTYGPHYNAETIASYTAQGIEIRDVERPAADGLEADGLAAALRELHAPGPILTHGDECTDEDHEHSPTSHSFGEDMCLDCPRSGEQYCTHCSDFNDDLVPYPCPTIALLPGDINDRADQEDR